MRAFKGQIKANKAMFRRLRLGSLFCLFLLLVLRCCLATLSRFGFSRPRLRGLILTALVAQAAKMTTQQKQLITSTNSSVLYWFVLVAVLKV
jgi:hypothetical protein